MAVSLYCCWMKTDACPALPRNLAILGSTGSIGRSTIDVIWSSEGMLRATALTAHSNLALLEQQARLLKPHWIVATDPTAAKRHDWSGCPRKPNC